MDITERKNNFINRSLMIHGYKYDYKFVDYKNNRYKVSIVCKDHGVFIQSPRTHLEGSGCPKCGGKCKLTTSDFIKRSESVHGKKFDYSLVDYKNNRGKVRIICPDHGIFEQIAFTHLSGTNCPSCSITHRLNKEDFINNSIKKHGNRYDYSLVCDTLNNKQKVKIICKKHGIFKQSYNNHVDKGNNCAKCMDINIRIGTRGFIKKSMEIHGNRYDYSLVKYKNNKTKVKIICPDHGIFEQPPQSHINLKCGCRRCKISKGERKIMNLLDNMEIYYIHLYILDKLEWDFYLPDYNTCIEYDGAQHYMPIKFFGVKRNLLNN